MKNITLFIFLLTISFGYSQVVLEDFEGDLPTTGSLDGIFASVQANPDQSGLNMSANALQLITDDAGQPWQGTKLLLQNNKIDMTTTDKTMTVDVYSTTPREFLAKLSDGDTGGTDAAQESKTAAAHTGSGWETLLFDFNIPADTSQPGYNPPNDQFSSILFFPLYDISNDGWCDGCGVGSALVSTTYVDNITGLAGDIIIPPLADPEAAPIPSTPDGEAYSIYNDTNNYSTTFPVSYDFGTLGSEPDLDPTANENRALKFDFSFAGWGQGEGAPDDVSAYGYVNFMYWAQAGVPGFQFRMISNNGGVQEFTYEIGTQETIVNEQWTLVSIPMTYFTNLGFPATSFYQWKCEAFMQVVTDPGIVYMDNIILTVNPLSTNEFETTQFKVYPNPAISNWTITTNSQINKVVVYDVLGKIVKTLNVNESNIQISTTGMIPGIYFAKLESDYGSKTIRLIKK